MKISWIRVLVSACVMLVACGEKTAWAKSGADKNVALRSWTSASGSVIEAEYVELKYGRVSLRTKAGKLLAIPLRSLSAEDRTWIKAAEIKRNAPPGIKAPAKSNALPTFDGGDMDGYHAVYTSRNYDACMTVGGTVEVYPKERGKRVGKAIYMRLACYYHHKIHGYSTRPVTSYLNPQPPVKQPSQITLRGLLADDVKFGVTYEFSEKGIKGYGYFEDPPDIKFPTMFRINAWLKASHKFANDVSLAEIQELLKDWRVVISPIEGKRRSFTYWESVQGMGLRSKKVVVDAPAFGSREISFTAGNPEKACLVPQIYSGYSPYQGYSVQLKSYGDNSKSKSKYIMINIE